MRRSGKGNSGRNRYILASSTAIPWQLGNSAGERRCVSVSFPMQRQCRVEVGTGEKVQAATLAATSSSCPRSGRC